MLLGRVRDASFAHEGLSRELRGPRAARACARIRGANKGAHETLRRLHRLLLAVVAVLACAGIIGPFRGILSVKTSIGVAARDSATARWLRSAPDASPQCGDLAERPVVDLKAIESHLDEEDDPLGDVADGPAVPVACAPAREPGRPPAVQVGTDTSRFAIGPSLARGPPV